MSFPNIIGHYRDGLYRRAVENIRSTADRTIEAKESGTIFNIGVVTAQVFQLPKISSKWLGIEHTFRVSTQNAGTVKINCALDSNATIKTNFSSEVAEHSTIVTDSSFASAITLTAVSSVVWMGQPIMCNSYKATTKKTDDSTTVKASLSGWTTG